MTGFLLMKRIQSLWDQDNFHGRGGAVPSLGIFCGKDQAKDRPTPYYYPLVVRTTTLSAGFIDIHMIYCLQASII
jgi:hypothetical protein